MSETGGSAAQEMSEPLGPQSTDEAASKPTFNLWFLVLVVGIVLAIVAASLPRRDSSWLRAASVDPQPFALSTSDLPTGFVVEQNGSYSSNEKAAGGDGFLLSQFDSFGRLNGYEISFVRARPHPNPLPEGEGTSVSREGEGIAARGDELDSPSLLKVHGSVAVYATVEGARSLVELLTSSTPEDMAVVPVPRLGDEAYATSSEFAAPESPEVYRFVTARKGTVVTSVVTTSLQGSGFRESIDLAHKAVAKIP